MQLRFTLMNGIKAKAIGFLLFLFLVISVLSVAAYGQDQRAVLDDGQTANASEAQAAVSQSSDLSLKHISGRGLDRFYVPPSTVRKQVTNSEREDAPEPDSRTSQNQQIDSLRFQISAYFWLPHVTGRVRPLASGPTMNIDTSIGDVIRDSDGAIMLNGTVRQDRFVFLWDFNWSGSSKEGQAFVPIAGGIPVSATAKIRQTAITLMGGSSIVQRPRTTVDIIGGVRIWYVKAEVNATLPPPFDFTRGSSTWVDPLAGVRVRQEIVPKWSVILYGDGGGFSAGSRSTFQLAGTLNYQATRHFFVSGGYRHLAFDYRKNGRLLDLHMSGPVIGVTWLF